MHGADHRGQRLDHNAEVLVARSVSGGLPPRPSEGYNSGVVSPIPKPQSDDRQHRRSIYAAESTGLLILALLLFVFIVIRYWRDIPWSAR